MLYIDALYICVSVFVCFFFWLQNYSNSFVAKLNVFCCMTSNFDMFKYKTDAGSLFYLRATTVYQMEIKCLYIYATNKERANWLFQYRLVLTATLNRTNKFTVRLKTYWIRQHELIQRIPTTCVSKNNKKMLKFPFNTNFHKTHSSSTL